MASSFAWRVWGGRAGSLFNSLRETPCCLSWASAGTPAKPNRTAIAITSANIFTRKRILPPILAGQISLRTPSRCDKKLLGNFPRRRSREACGSLRRQRLLILGGIDGFPFSLAACCPDLPAAPSFAQLLEREDGF